MCATEPACIFPRSRPCPDHDDAERQDHDDPYARLRQQITDTLSAPLITARTRHTRAGVVHFAVAGLTLCGVMVAEPAPGEGVGCESCVAGLGRRDQAIARAEQAIARDRQKERERERRAAAAAAREPVDPIERGLRAWKTYQARQAGQDPATNAADA